MARRRLSVATPRLSWVHLDRRALAAARSSLEGTFQGVRDELGLGAIHFGYADRFFPGTSVLLTRLRYALFVPWLYNDLLKSHPSNSFPETELRDQERLLGLALMKHFEEEGVGLEGSGIIGHTVLKDRAPVVLPSQIYWPSLARWKIVADGQDGVEPPMRMAVHGAWEHYAPSPTMRRRPLEGEPEPPILFDLPTYRNGSHPADWSRRNRYGIKFALSPEERTFFADKLSRLQREDGKGCLLAGLAKRAVRGETFDNPYSAKVRQLCDDADRAALDRAHRAGKLGQFARSIYSALVEELREEEGIANSAVARNHLKALRENRASVTLVTQLNLDDLRLDGVIIDSELLLLLKRVQSWCAGNAPVSELLIHFRNRERKRKTVAKARLELRNRDRRKARQQPDWTPGPLSYRWSNVQTLLNDLAATS